jgi:hypothetical protein
MSLLDYVDECMDEVEKLVRHMDYVCPVELGLDRRAAYRLFVDSECVVVRKNEDRTLQYYGGFEYVDKEYRTEFGDYVIYTADGDRVSACIQYLLEASPNE